MDNKAIFLLAAVCAQSVVLGSYQHGSVARPVVLESGYLADTHEVASAKSAHLAALAKGAHGHGYGGDHYDHSDGHGHDIRYHGPTAIPHVLKNGHIADTHEVAAAKAEHYAAVANANVHGEYGYAGDYAYAFDNGHGTRSHGHGYPHQHYHGLLAKPVVLPSGYLADTHEVQAARHHHIEALHNIHY